MPPSVEPIAIREAPARRRLLPTPPLAGHLGAGSDALTLASRARARLTAFPASVVGMTQAFEWLCCLGW